MKPAQSAKAVQEEAGKKASQDEPAGALHMDRGPVSMAGNGYVSSSNP
jgi:hypothetical protein